MATLLLIVIFTGYIGLGIPDSLLGSAWPEICLELGIDQSLAWTITTPITCCTLISSLFSAQIIEKLGAKLVTIISTALTATALFLTSFAGSSWAFILIGIPLGIGAGAIDSALNNYVALHYKASHMNFLHCFYGVGVALSPYLMSIAISFMSWRDGYKLASLIQLVITAILAISSPLWKVHQKESQTEGAKSLNLLNGENLSGTQKQLGSYKLIFKNPYCIPVGLVFTLACVIECTCGLWATTYLVSVKNASTSDGALYLAVFYIGLALGRFLSGVLSSKLTPNKINLIGILILLVATGSLLLPTATIYPALAAIFLIGLGVGPLYPNMSFLTPEHFGEVNSQKAMGVQMAFAYIGVLLGPTLMGALSSAFGMEIFGIYMFLATVLTAICYFIYTKFYKAQTAKNAD